MRLPSVRVPARLRGFTIGALRAVGGAAAGGFLSVLVIVTFYFFAPGSFFLDAEDKVTVADAVVGEDIPFKWCRDPRFGPIDADAIRTFYRKDAAGNFPGVGEYRFDANIEPTNVDCPDLTIMSKRQPKVEGTYYFVTDLTWQELGIEKHFRYVSDYYEVGATVEALQERIRQNELENEMLREQIRTLKGEPVVITQPEAIAAAPSEATVRINEPTNSAPPTLTPTPADSAPPTRPALLLDLEPLLVGAYETAQSVPLVGGLLP